MKEKWETHLHVADTSWCAHTSLDDIITEYKGKGYSGIVTTNHYHDPCFNHFKIYGKSDRKDFFLDNIAKADKKAREYEFKLLHGMELWQQTETGNRDLLIYTPEIEKLLDADDLYCMPGHDLYDLVKSTGGIIVQAHPYRDYCTLADPRLIDGVEVFNGHPTHDNKNDLALIFAKVNNLFMLSGSDFHDLPYSATGGIITEYEINTIDDFINVVSTGKIELLRNIY